MRIPRAGKFPDPGPSSLTQVNRLARPNSLFMVDLALGAPGTHVDRPARTPRPPRADRRRAHRACARPCGLGCRSRCAREQYLGGGDRAGRHRPPGLDGARSPGGPHGGRRDRVRVDVGGAAARRDAGGGRGRRHVCRRQRAGGFRRRARRARPQVTGRSRAAGRASPQGERAIEDVADRSRSRSATRSWCAPAKSSLSTASSPARAPCSTRRR